MKRKWKKCMVKEEIFKRVFLSTSPTLSFEMCSFSYATCVILCRYFVISGCTGFIKNWRSFFCLSLFRVVFCLLFILPGGNICRADEFLCNNSLCKLHFWVCDGEDDCGDNSDEVAEMCGMTLHFSVLFV